MLESRPLATELAISSPYGLYHPRLTSYAVSDARDSLYANSMSKFITPAPDALPAVGFNAGIVAANLGPGPDLSFGCFSTVGKNSGWFVTTAPFE